MVQVMSNGMDDSSDNSIDYSQPLPQLNPASFGQINRDIAAIDPRVFGGIVQPAGQKDEFLFNHAPRHWGDKLTYSLGVSYLSGALMGAAYGTVEGMRAGAGLPLKLKVNRLLNHTGHRGGKLANGLGGLSK